MRIDPKVPATSLDTQKSHAAKPSEPPQNSTQTPTAAGASVVALSAIASSIPPQTASAAIAARLDKIREMLNSGQYPVDLDLLASRIVDDEALRSRKPS